MVTDSLREQGWKLICATFPERQIYIRSDGRVQFFTFGPLMQAILAGTASAAEALGRDDVGILEAGRFADLVAVAGDPIANIGLLRTPAAVIKGGEVVFGR